MKILFEKKNTNWDVENNISIKILENKSVKIQVENFIKDKTESAYFLDKTELSEFIGALLHIQSKINRNGK